jgi:hypothetical protein
VWSSGCGEPDEDAEERLPVVPSRGERISVVDCNGACGDDPQRMLDSERRDPVLEVSHLRCMQTSHQSELLWATTARSVRFDAAGLVDLCDGCGAKRAIVLG